MLTLGDLWTGHFTWLQVLREALPIMLVAVTSFFAGHARGRVVEQRLWTKEPR